MTELNEAAVEAAARAHVEAGGFSEQHSWDALSQVQRDAIGEYLRPAIRAAFQRATPEDVPHVAAEAWDAGWVAAGKSPYTAKNPYRADRLDREQR